MTNRYQKPELFESLAIAYVVGTLRGKARLRFEKLMAQHFYLRAVTDGWQQRLAPLATLLPAEQPPARVWHNIARTLQQQQRGKRAASGWLGRLREYLGVPVAAVASLTAVAVVAVSLYFQQPSAYMATLQSPLRQDAMAVALVNRDDMDITITLPAGSLPATGGMTPTLWCIPKDSSHPPMRIGVLAQNSTEHRLPIEQATWRQMGDIDEFVISMEAGDNPANTAPTGETLFRGKLSSL